jgi:hypothetical protein
MIWKHVSDNSEYTGKRIHAFTGIQTHSLSVQAIKAYASDRAATGTGIISKILMINVVEIEENHYPFSVNNFVSLESPISNTFKKKTPSYKWLVMLGENRTES